MQCTEFIILFGICHAPFQTNPLPQLLVDFRGKQKFSKAIGDYYIF